MTDTAFLDPPVAPSAPAPRPPSGRPPTVVAHDLRKAYGSFTAVDGVSLEVAAGAVVGLLGPNGAGKTTLIRMLLGLTTPTSGRASVLGAQLGTAEFDRARTRVGAMIEGPSPYLALSGRRNVEVQARTLGVPRLGEAVDRVLDVVELTDRQHDKARGYSLGMKQRLGIAMALVANPEILILDEPANGLDPAGIVDLRRLLRRLAAQGITVLVSSHQLAEVQQACDDLVVMAAGRVIASGTTAGLVRRHQGPGTVEVDVAPADLGRAASVLTTIGDVSIDGTTLAVVPRGDVAARDLNRALFDAGVVAERLQVRTRSLEDVFLELTATAPTTTTEVSR